VSGREVTKIEPRLKTHYENHVRPKLLEEFQFKNAHQLPRLVKVVLNVGMGDAAKDQKLLDSVVSELGIITGQKANTNRARRSISNFGLREGMPVGASVTLRRDRMWFFLDRLLSTAIPRVRDFRGLQTRSFDGRGNYTMGIREQIIFPEINFDDVRKIHGMDLTFVTSTNKDDEGLALLRELGFPFRGQVPVAIGATA
jgi:large subunit ribosomal protein L5